MAETLRDLVQLSIVVDPTYDQNCYVLQRRDTNEVLVIDPGLQHNALLKLLDTQNFHCGQILLTHGHPDHVNGVPFIRSAYNCSAAIHPADRPMLEFVTSLPGIPADTPPVECDQDLTQDQILSWQGLEIQILSTPGHTQGSVCFLINTPDSTLFSGDTLFKHGVGRSDLPGGSWPALVFSIENKLYRLSPETLVYPGHGERTLISEEMQANPFVVHPSYR